MDVEHIFSINNKGNILLDDTIDKWYLGFYSKTSIPNTNMEYTGTSEYSGTGSCIKRSNSETINRGMSSIKWECDDDIVSDAGFTISEASPTESCGFNFHGRVKCCDISYPGLSDY